MAALLQGYASPVRLVIEAAAFGACYAAVWAVLGDRESVFDIARTMLTRMDRSAA
jgi:hypothetical protein